jgi:hypothetical protein
MGKRKVTQTKPSELITKLVAEINKQLPLAMAEGDKILFKYSISEATGDDIPTTISIVPIVYKRSA